MSGPAVLCCLRSRYTYFQVLNDKMRIGRDSETWSNQLRCTREKIVCLYCDSLIYSLFFQAREWKWPLSKLESHRTPSRAAPLALYLKLRADCTNHTSYTRRHVCPCYGEELSQTLKLGNGRTATPKVLLSNESRSPIILAVIYHYGRQRCRVRCTEGR